LCKKNKLITKMENFRIRNSEMTVLNKIDYRMLTYHITNYFYEKTNNN